MEQLSAAETVRQACDTLAESNHDATFVGTNGSVKVVQTFSFSGADYHLVGKAYAPGSDTL